MTDAPDGWVVWTDEGDRRVLVYRPDVFDADAYPPPCLPTLYVVADPPRGRRRNGEGWHVRLTLEPDVAVVDDRFDDRERAIAAASDVAARFAGGEIDYRSAYQVPREAYLDRLDDLTGRAEGEA